MDSIYTASEQAQAPPLGQCLISGARVSHLIGIAYGIPMNRLEGGPGWVQRGDRRFDVQAKAENGSAVTEQELHTMLQNLLAERFQLKHHYATAMVRGFALTVSKRETKLTESQSEVSGIAYEGGKRIPGEPFTVRGRRYSMAMLADWLSRVAGTTIVDKTGLGGDYDFSLIIDEESAAAVARAVRELGLSLEAAEVTISTFVVDSMQEPTPN